jgi:riboflavin kinase/FMN adenylyltransferase
VRWLLSCGRVVDARLCLGRPHLLKGTVVVGERRGRNLGYPTVNLETAAQLLPADGVYAGHTEVDGRRFAAAISIGAKPTFDGSRRTCEAYLLEFEGNLYGRTLEIACSRWLRDQYRFPSIEALRAQLDHDVAETRRLDAMDLLDPATLVRAAG